MKKLYSQLLTWPKDSNKRILPPLEAKNFFYLMDNLDIFVGKESGIFDPSKSIETIDDLNVVRQKIHTYWNNHPEIIDQFIASKEIDLTEEQKDILIKWKKPISGSSFLCIKYCARYAIFVPMKQKNNNNYYAILGLTQDFDDLLPYSKPPYMVDTLLLAYKDVIVWDGSVALYSMSFGPGIRKSFNEEYQEAKKLGHIIAKIN